MISINELLEPAACRVVLHRQQERIHAPNPKVAASMIMKKYARAYPEYVLNSMLWEEVYPIVPREACTFSEELSLNIDASLVVNTSSKSQAWKHLVQDHLTPLVEAFHTTTRLPMMILWENVAVRFNSYFRKAIQQHPEHKNTITQLAESLQQLEGRYFNQETNPIIPYLVPISDLTQSKTRQTCCYYYKLDKEKEMSHCLVCPLK